MQSEKQGRLQTSFLYFKGEICIALFALFVMFLTSAFTGCGDDVENTYSACPELYTLQDGECVKIEPIIDLICPDGYQVVVDECIRIDDGTLDCGASRTFQINFLDATSKQPIIFPITTTMQRKRTLDDSNGRHRLNDPDGVYLYNNIILCDEYQISASAVCYESLDRADWEVPRATIYTIELQAKTQCNNNELDEAFAQCMLESQTPTLCCMAFMQEQFDLQCGRSYD